MDAKNNNLFTLHCSFLILNIVLILSSSLSLADAETQYHDFVIQATPVKRLCNTQSIITVNGQYPGPTLEVNNGDTLVIKVTNKAQYNATIHWHGIKQMRTAWADGPEYVTQCPIQPGATFTYRFTIEGQEGTLWWHAHSSWLRATVYGALIIHPKPGNSYPFTKPDGETALLLGEWWNANPMDIIAQATRTGAAPDLSNAYTINGQPGDLYNCSSEAVRMGRKKNNESSKGTSQNPWTVNCSTSARNTRKSDLAAVIFGCKHSTVKECFSKKLFGLPATHFAYITKIDPGLPLFLFNYSDRKLHGIFEATSKGQLNIDPIAWIKEGTESTPFPAQVRFTIKTRCQPLSEYQFQPIISENYYNEKHFWNELDHEQTRNLLAVFSSTPRSSSNSTPENGNTLLKITPSLDREQDNVAFETRTVNNLGIPYNDALGQDDDKRKNSKIVMNEERVENYVLERLPTCKPSYSDVVRNKNPVLTEEYMSKNTLEPAVNTMFPQTELGCSWDAEPSYSLEPGSSWEAEASATYTNLGYSDQQIKEWGALEMHPMKPKPSWDTEPGDSSDGVTPVSNTNPIFSDQQYTEWGFLEEHFEPNSSWGAERGSNWDTVKVSPDTEQGYSDQQNPEQGSAKEQFVEPSCSWDDKQVSYWDSCLTVSTGSAVINTKQGVYAEESRANLEHPFVVSHSGKIDRN